MGAALLKLSVDGPLTTRNRKQLMLVVATEGNVMNARRGYAASLPRHLCHSLSLLLTMDCFFFSVCSWHLLPVGKEKCHCHSESSTIISTKDVLCMPGVFQYRLLGGGIRLARSYQLQWLVAQRLPTQTPVPDPTLVLDQT